MQSAMPRAEDSSSLQYPLDPNLDPGPEEIESNASGHCSSDDDNDGSGAHPNTSQDRSLRRDRNPPTDNHQSGRRRQPLADSQRRALRQKKRESTLTQKQLVEWFSNTFSRHITQSQVSDILSSRFDRLDHVPADSLQGLDTSYRFTEGQFPELEAQLWEWQQRESASSSTRVTGDMLKARAAELWDSMPQYHAPTDAASPDRRATARPAFSNGWLEGYRRRHGLVSARTSTAAGNAASARPSVVSSDDVASAAAPATAAVLPPDARRLAAPPKPAYLPQPGSPLLVDRDTYARLAAAPRRLHARIHVPRRSARAFRCPAASIVRISTPLGAQVGDLNLWSLRNPRERFWAARTRQLHGSHLSTYDRLWSNLPYLRPLATVVGDTLGPRYGTDEHGGRVHDLLGTRCDPYVNALLSGTQYDFHCHSNLVRSVRRWGLEESDVHDVLNVFQVTGLTDWQEDVAAAAAEETSPSHPSLSSPPLEEAESQQQKDTQKKSGMYWMGTCPADSGDYFEFFAETEMLAALSACPGGDLSCWGFDGEAGERMKRSCRPLRVEVFTVAEEALREAGWRGEPRFGWEMYRGMHGMKVPVGESDEDADEDDDVDDYELPEEGDDEFGERLGEGELEAWRRMAREEVRGRHGEEEDGEGGWRRATGGQDERMDEDGGS